MFNAISGLIDSLFENQVIRTIAVVIAIVIAITAIVALVVAGIGIAAFLLLVVLIAVSIYFGSIRVLAGSALLATLLHVLGGTIEEFVSVWFAGPEATQFFDLVAETGLIRLILVFFFFFYLLSFGTRSVNLFHFDNKVNVENKVEGKERQDDAEKAHGKVVDGRVSSGRRKP